MAKILDYEGLKRFHEGLLEHGGIKPDPTKTSTIVVKTSDKSLLGGEVRVIIAGHEYIENFPLEFDSNGFAIVNVIVAEIGIAAITVSNGTDSAEDSVEVADFYQTYTLEFSLKHELVKYTGTVDPIYRNPTYTTRINPAMVRIGNYALIGGGHYMRAANKYGYNTVDVYDDSLVKTNATVLSYNRLGLNAVNVNKQYALFSAGYDYNTRFANYVDAYDESLTRISAPSSSYADSTPSESFSIGKYGVFCFGSSYEVYNDSLTKTTMSGAWCAGCAVTTTEDYAFIGGGNTVIERPWQADPRVYAYDKSLVRVSVPDLSIGRSTPGAVSVGDYCLFGGGLRYSANAGAGAYYQTAVDAYDKSLTRTSISDLSYGRTVYASVNLENQYGMFLGGKSYTDSASQTIIDAYDKSLTRTLPTPLTSYQSFRPVTVGKYALIFGYGAITPMIYELV